MSTNKTIQVQAITNKGWNDRTVLQRNAYTTANKLNKADFSILGKADVIKHDPTNNSPFLYRLDANQPGRWGGVWQAPNHYTFTSTFSNLTGVTMVKKFDKWTSGPFAISDRMPWLPKLDELVLLTTNDRLIQQIPWGTIVSRQKWLFQPSPWIYSEMIFPERIWYWLKEEKRGRSKVKGLIIIKNVLAICPSFRIHIYVFNQLSSRRSEYILVDYTSNVIRKCKFVSLLTICSNCKRNVKLFPRV